MTPAPGLPDILRPSPVRVEFGEGALGRLGTRAGETAARRALLVTDGAIRAAGHVERAINSLHAAFIDVIVFDGAEQNPTSETIAAGLAAARRGATVALQRGDKRETTTTVIDLIIGLGGGSAMDCAKGVNLLYTNGGQIGDYRGDPPADVLARRKPLLPMILIPTTAGTGSEAQSFALISDAKTHMKMACGDRRPPDAGGLRPRCAILDPQLTWTMPPSVVAATGLDAISHAVETAGCRARSGVSREFSRQAWARLSRAFPRVMQGPHDAEARGEMLLGAHLAGCAIESAMLGAAHACANPLTAKFHTVHGLAVGVMLPHVVRFNAAGGTNPYADLCDAEQLANKLEALLDLAGVPRRLREHGVPAEATSELAELAATQWTAGFNPRPVGAAEFRHLFEAAF